MAGQGHSMREQEVRQIIHLLSSTDMAPGEIAERMSCSKSTVLSINRKFRVRDYNGLRSSWLTVDSEPEQKSA
jgi:DNA-binding CsgD family transcriptional regulator